MLSRGSDVVDQSISMISADRPGRIGTMPHPDRIPRGTQPGAVGKPAGGPDFCSARQISGLEIKLTAGVPRPR